MPGQVVVEVEDVEVQPAHAAEPEQDEVPGQAGDVGMETNNLLVKAALVGSVASVQDGEDGPIVLPGQAAGGGEVALPDRFGVLGGGAGRGPGAQSQSGQ